MSDERSRAGTVALWAERAREVSRAFAARSALGRVVDVGEARSDRVSCTAFDVDALTLDAPPSPRMSSSGGESPTARVENEIDGESESESETDDTRRNSAINVASNPRRKRPKAAPTLHEFHAAIERDAMTLHERLRLIDGADLYSLRGMFAEIFGRETSSDRMSWLRTACVNRYRALHAVCDGCKVLMTSAKPGAGFVIVDENTGAITHMRHKSRKRASAALRSSTSSHESDEEESFLGNESPRAKRVQTARHTTHWWRSCPFATGERAPAGSSACANCHALDLLLMYPTFHAVGC